MTRKKLDNKSSLNKHQLRVLRDNNPKIHLYEKPFIGTEEIRQYLYCKRILYFRYVLSAPMKPTYKMDVGSEKHEYINKLKNKSKLKENYENRYYNIYLSDPEIGLVGLIDLFEFDGKEAYPIEFKTGDIPPSEIDNPHKYQVVAQAMLIEKNFDFLVNKVRIYYIKRDKFIDYYINVEDKLKVLGIVREIGDLINSEVIPEPTEDKGKCVDCECRNYCMTV
ncbi:MAG: CRISPR-associated protein Cas4 [Promethearchaeota archaeon]